MEKRVDFRAICTKGSGDMLEEGCSVLQWREESKVQGLQKCDKVWCQVCQSKEDKGWLWVCQQSSRVIGVTGGFLLQLMVGIL